MDGNGKFSDLLNSTLNKTDAFSQRMNQTSKSFMSKSGQFKRKTSYNKKNEKLWTLLDKFKNQIEEDKQRE